MAIVIPSSKTYDRQNPKVRDNVIERIEVWAVEVVPDNDYETPVYNEKIIVENYEKGQLANTNSAVNSFFRDSWTLAYGIGVAKTQITRMYCSGTIKVPKLKNNTLIDQILSKTDKDGNAKIKYSSRCTKKTGTVSNVETLTETIYNPDSGAARIEVAVTNNTIIESNRTFTAEKKGESLPDTKYYNPSDTISFEKKYTVEGNNYKVSVKTTYPDDTTNLGSLDVRYNTETEQYEFDYTLLCGIGFDRLGWTRNSTFTIGSSSNTVTNTQSIELFGETEFYFPEQVEITVYGNTIGIDLTDKTVYINGETAKKVHSVDGNELMQTSNYIMGENVTKTNALDKMYGDTQIDYARGKETATIRCSISDYYDGDQKVIAIDNSTGKMSFKIYDQVIPMVYGADGQDRPMSTYQDGSPKVFQVLGSKIFYDGAVWQEISLQELDKNEIV